MGLTATAASSSQINLTWTASTDNVGVTAYQVFRDEVFRATVSAPAVNFSDTGLAASTLYSYTVTACDAAGNCSAQAAASATTLAAGQNLFVPNLEPGVNLISNALNTTLDVTVTFGNSDAPVDGVTSNVVSIWKWNAVDGRWAFNSPQLAAADNAAYAAAHNYEVLSVINPGEGYWVNSNVPLTLTSQLGAGFTWTGINFAALPSGFNLITTADSYTPSQFNVAVTNPPPAQGVIPTTNFVSL
ncbi:MAG: fibronectin type III domain-containing protein [Betaproteobacteria bacterium]|nr:fibronectin type III domain-containing protein [Betaproteobacteria bacterium]